MWIDEIRLRHRSKFHHKKGVGVKGLVVVYKVIYIITCINLLSFQKY